MGGIPIAPVLSVVSTVASSFMSKPSAPSGGGQPAPAPAPVEKEEKSNVDDSSGDAFVSARRAKGRRSTQLLGSSGSENVQKKTLLGD